jgi:RNA-directed DNA polymerase
MLIYDVLNMDNLIRAWEAVSDNNGIPGVDDISIKKWRRNWEERLIELAKNVRKNTYHPKRLRMRTIPKKTPPFFRILRIPTVTDRVLQRAVSQVLMPIYELIFLDFSFGYRPNRGLINAVERILVLRENGYREVLSADIDGFFDSVDHELLLRFLQSDLPDESLIPMINEWLEISAISKNGSSGIPQGSPLSPVLANVFLHRFDLLMAANNVEIVRYADDFVVLCKTHERITEALTIVQSALKSLSLFLEPKKTALTNFDEGFTFLGVYFIQDTYQYTWEDKRIKVSGNEVDWLFSKYGSSYT